MVSTRSSRSPCWIDTRTRRNPIRNEHQTNWWGNINSKTSHTRIWILSFYTRPSEQGLICVFSVTRGSAADRAGLGQLWEEANKTGSLVVIARLEGRSLLPSTVSSAGLISCCDHSEIKDTLNSMMDQMENVHLQVMAWPNQTFPQAPQATGAAKLRPPSEYYSMPPLWQTRYSNEQLGLFGQGGLSR